MRTSTGLGKLDVAGLLAGPINHDEGSTHDPYLFPDEKNQGLGCTFHLHIS